MKLELHPNDRAYSMGYRDGVKAEREEIFKTISNLSAFFDRDTEKAKGARYGLDMLLQALTPTTDKQ